MKINNGKCRVLYLGRNNPKHQYRLRADQLVNNSTEKALTSPGGHLIGHKPTM